MIFEYEALNNKGKAVADVIDAPSEQVARQKLRGQGLYVTKIRQHDVIRKASGTAKEGALRRYYEDVVHYFRLKFSAKQVGLFSRQLATLLNAGMPLLTSINDIIEQIDSQDFKHIIVDIKEKLEEGSSFSSCLDRHRAVFSDMYINMVRVGENLGSLDQVMERLADLEEKKNILKSKIQAAMWYPSFLVFFSLVVITFIMVNIIPSLGRMFLELGRELPLPTRIVMAVSNFLSTFWFFIFLAIGIGVYYLNKYVKTPDGKRKFDDLKLRMPLFSNLYRKLIVLRFTQNLGILLNNRVDIIKSFEIVKKIVMNCVVEDKIDDAAHKIKEGASVATALSKTDFLPKLVIGMITAGEASDTLDKMLLNIGHVYETEIDLTVSSLTSLIEPIIIVIMGLTIGLIVIAVLLPIFEMNLMMQ